MFNYFLKPLNKKAKGNKNGGPRKEKDQKKGKMASACKYLFELLLQQYESAGTCIQPKNLEKARKLRAQLGL